MEVNTYFYLLSLGITQFMSVTTHDDSNQPNEDELGNYPNLLIPLIDLLKQTEGPMGNIETAEGIGPDEKTTLLKSAIGILSDNRIVHMISLSAYLLREIFIKFAKEESKYLDPTEKYECKLYDYRCFPKKDLNRIRKVANPKFQFESPNKLIWVGKMTDDEKDNLLAYSDHPFWKVAIYEIYNTKKDKRTNQAIRNQRITNFLNRHKSKFTLSSNQFPQLIENINDLITNSNRITHNTKKYRSVGEALLQNNPLIPDEAKQEFIEFSELIVEFGKLMENFKFKPIGKLKQLDEIINE